MTHRTSTPSSFIVALSLFFSASLTAACASPSRQNEASAPKSSDASADDGSSTAPNAGAPTERAEAKPGAAAEGELYASPKEAAATEAMQAAPEEGTDLDGGDSSPASGVPKAAPALTETALEKKKGDLLGELKLQVLDFDESLQPVTLSCGGAKPLKDAICSIAGRICEMEAPSTVKSVHCSQAQESCEKAKRDFKTRCS